MNGSSDRDRPNVVIIVADALRADRVGALGGRPLTPNIDQLAADSAAFTNAFSTGNTTDVAVTSIQTGQHPLSHGILQHGSRVTEAEKSAVETVTQLPELLSAAGYRTAKFGRPLGRWHRKGFDSYPSSMESRTAFDVDDTTASDTLRSATSSALSAVHPSLADIASTALSQVTGSATSQDGNLELNDPETDRVLQSFEEFVGSEEPFYSFIHLMDTHAPYYADPDLVTQYLERYDYDVERVDNIGVKASKRFHELVEDGEYPEIADKYYFPDGSPSTAIIDAHYDGAVTQVDRRVGRILSVLEETDILDETLVVFLSDHGESLTEHGIYYTHSHGLYDEIARVPLLIRPPGGTSGTVDQLVQITDIAPTVTSYVGVDGLAPDGLSLRPVLEANEALDRESLIVEHAHTGRRRMLRTAENSFMYALDTDTVCRKCGIQHAPEQELYDVTSDPAESDNLAAERPDRAAELRDRAEALAESFEQSRDDGDGEPVEYEDEAVVFERMKALGYR